MAATFELPKLPYGLSDLEPVISAEIMDIHYNKHHNTYLQNLNKLLEQYEGAEKNNDLETMIALSTGIQFNAGGYFNHHVYWTNLAPQSQGGGTPPQGQLAEAINKDLGSFENMKKILTAKTIGIQGSGWGWLGFNKALNRLEITTCQNQEMMASKGLVPLLTIDVWEHAYYLQYKNNRGAYVEAIWDIVNWKNVTERFEALG